MKRRLQRHMLDHDDDFVRRVPKSDNYKVKYLKLQILMPRLAPKLHS